MKKAVEEIIDIEVEGTTVELQVTNKSLPMIQTNYEEVKSYLQHQLKKYETMIVTEDTLKDSKESQRELSKLKKSIDDYRKSIKQEMLVPVSEFEDKCKELIDIVATVEKPIKDGIEVFNDKLRQDRLDYANEIITAHSSNFGLDVSDFKILDSFTNISGTKKAISDELDRQMTELVKIKEQLANNIKLLREQVEQLNTSFELEVKMEFKDIESRISDNNFMELSQYLLSEATRRKQTQDRIKEQMRLKEEAEKSKREEEERQKAIENAIITAPEQVITEVPEVAEVKQEDITEVEVRTVDEETGEVMKVLEITLKLTGTNEQLVGLRKYIDDNDISYEKVKGEK